MKKCFAVSNNPVKVDIVLLLIRLVCGYAFMLHGWGKIQNPFGWAGPESAIPGFLLGLAALAEFGGGLAWILGLLTRLAALGIGITMMVAAYMHLLVFGDPFVATGPGGSAEPAVMFLLIAILLKVMGPGRYSLDAKIFGTK